MARQTQPLIDAYGEPIYDDAFYRRLAKAREAEMPPSLAAIAHMERSEADALERGAEFPEREEPRFVRDVYVCRTPDGGGFYCPRWVQDIDR